MPETTSPPWGDEPCTPGDAEWQRRLDWFMAQPCDGWWWLSFVDPDRPKGKRSLGICIVPGGNIVQAGQMAWAVGCNPGGQVAGWDISAAFTDRAPHPSVVGRLWSGDDAQAIADHDLREPFEP